MSIQLAEPTRAEPRLPEPQLAERTPIEPKLVDPSVVSAPVARTLPAYGSDHCGEGDRTDAARGIMIALLIALPLWVLIAYTIYLLL
jgi:hypothetical protein